MTDTIAQVVYDPDTNQWIDTTTGQPVSVEDIQAELDRHIDAAQDNLEGLTVALYAGAITLADWQLAAAAELEDAHIAQAMFGAGGVDNVTPSMIDRIQGTLTSEFVFLAGFATAIAAGTVSEPQALARIAQYGNDTGQSYWREWGAMRESAIAEGVHRLTRLPEDGSTICRGNCRCSLSDNGDGTVNWDLSAVESCDTCVEMEAGNPWRPM